MSLKNKIWYTAGLLTFLTLFTGDSKQRTKEYHFSPLVQKEEITLPVSEVMKFYFDCNQKFYNSRDFRLTRTNKELEDIIKRRRNFEGNLTRYYNERISLSRLTFNPVDTTIGWHDPLNGIGWFE